VRREAWRVLRRGAAVRGWAQIATLNGRIILHGGSSNTPGMRCQDDTWIYDPDTSMVREREREMRTSDLVRVGSPCERSLT
jgi:hypothetical protein